VRKGWEERKSILQDEFDIAALVGKIDEQVLRLAKRDFDLLQSPPASGPQRILHSTAQSVSVERVAPPVVDPSKSKKAKVVCYKCGEAGHYANKCTNPKAKKLS
jgi:hypothetical protein